MGCRPGEVARVVRDACPCYDDRLGERGFEKVNLAGSFRTFLVQWQLRNAVLQYSSLQCPLVLVIIPVRWPLLWLI